VIPTLLASIVGEVLNLV